MQHLRSTRCAGLTCVAWVALGATGWMQPAAPPPLPDVPLDSYASPAREDIASAYERARQAPETGEAAGALGMRLQAWDQYELAADVYARAQALAPTALDWWYLGGLTSTALAQHDDAVRQLTRAVALGPDHPLVALRLAQAQMDAGDTTSAAAAFQRLVDVPGVSADAWFGLARVALARADVPAAREALTRALAIFPAFGAAHYAMAQVHRQSGDRAAARASLVARGQCLACAPAPDDPWLTRVTELRDDAAAQLTRGIAMASTGQAAGHAEAIRLHEQALAADATRGQAQVNLIELYGRTGNLEAASRHYAAARTQPGFAADAHRAYGLALLAARRADDALAPLTHAVTLAPDDATAHRSLGLALEILTRPSEAVEAYSAALRLAPTDRQARFALARSLVRLQRVTDAIPHLETLREPRDADAPRYLFALSAAYVASGRVAEGRQAGEQALTLARQFGDTQTAAAIEVELRKLERRR